MQHLFAGWCNAFSCEGVTITNFNAVIPARLHRYAKHCGQAKAGIQYQD